MYDVTVKATFDLGAEAAPEHEPLRQALRQMLEDHPSPNRYDGFTDNSGQRFRPIAGLLAQADFNDYLFQQDGWRNYAGLATTLVQLSATGGDHFPVPGLYRHDDGLTHATVTYKVEHAFPVQEETLHALVKAAYDDARYMQEARLVVPVVFWRTWQLTLTSSTFDRAFAAYETLRGGIWQPTVKFIDALSDQRKFSLIEQTIEPSPEGED